MITKEFRHQVYEANISLDERVGECMRVQGKPYLDIILENKGKTLYLVQEEEFLRVDVDCDGVIRNEERMRTNSSDVFSNLNGALYHMRPGTVLVNPRPAYLIGIMTELLLTDPRITLKRDSKTLKEVKYDLKDIIIDPSTNVLFQNRDETKKDPALCRYLQEKDHFPANYVIVHGDHSVEGTIDGFYTKSLMRDSRLQEYLTGRLNVVFTDPELAGHSVIKAFQKYDVNLIDLS